MSPAEELAEDLIGTCASCVVDEKLHSPADIAEFDRLAFECQGCGWWCSTDELNNETDRNLCDECAEEHGDEGEE